MGRVHLLRAGENFASIRLMTKPGKGQVFDVDGALFQAIGNPHEVIRNGRGVTMLACDARTQEVPGDECAIEVEPLEAPRTKVKSDRRIDDM